MGHRNRVRLARCAVMGSSLAMLSVSVWGSDRVSPVIKINEAAATAPIETVSLRDGVSVLLGSGGNIGVVTGRDGKFMIDAGIAVSRPRVEAALNALGPQPVRYLVNTHYHWDHTDGNTWLAGKDVQVAATSGTIKRVSQTTRVDDWDFTFKPLPKAAVPGTVVASSKHWTVDGQTITAIKVVPSHTDTDLYVTIQPADVIFLGDLFWNGVYPFIDNENGGGIDGMVRVLDRILPTIGDKAVVVPGHGPVGNKADVKDFRDMLAGIRDKVAALKKEGRSRDEVIAAKPTAAWDAKYGHFVIDPDFFARIAYDGTP
ncbi:MBL fold metallo-hydrolase [Luteibacter sp. E-22]|uniref:MBL fold metallo-hydrolase n=1 Tax=Luteibacter sp. E-22 TaxID=3404050 RepID=UPI003CE6A4F1